jgi:hypothetical protein
MTDIIPDAAKAVRPLSMNDTLPSGNPSLRTVLIAFGVVAIGAIALALHSWHWF